MKTEDMREWDLLFIETNSVLAQFSSAVDMVETVGGCRTMLYCCVCGSKNSYNLVIQRQNKIKTMISNDHIERLKYQRFSYTWGSLRCDKIFPPLGLRLSIIHSCSETGVCVLLVALVFVTLPDRADTSNLSVDWDNRLSCIPLACFFSLPSPPACSARCDTFSIACLLISCNGWVMQIEKVCTKTKSTTPK